MNCLPYYQFIFLYIILEKIGTKYTENDIYFDKCHLNYFSFLNFTIILKVFKIHKTVRPVSAKTASHILA